MSEITKLLAAAGLIAAGFFGASMFGAPDAGEAPTGAPGDWTPQRLEPLSSDAVGQPAPPGFSAPDENVALASHTDGNAFAWDHNSVFGESNAIEHSVARPSFPSEQPGSGAPEIRRTPLGDSTTSPSVPSDLRVSSLTPPALLDTPTNASPLRRTTFPQKPSNLTLPPEVMNPSSPTAGPSFSPPQSAASSSWPSSSHDEWGSTNDWNASSKGRSLAPLTPAPPAGNADLVWHVVSNGDTLAKIAERYLGDPYRAREIYELNQDRLQSPDLLPIGVELRIPERNAGPSVISVFDSGGAASNEFAPQSRLVPLPQLPDSVRAAPRARLQPPVSASLVNSP